MSKHTVGPWSVYRDAKNYGKDHLAVIGGNVLICDINKLQRNVMGKPANPEADARLIAAAPDLLLACEELVRESRLMSNLCCVCRRTQACAADCPVELARAALALVEREAGA